MWVLRHIRNALFLLLVRAVLYPIFAFRDLVNRLEIRRHGEISSQRKHRDTSEGIFAVFHLFARHALPTSTRRALQALAELRVNIVVVSNGPLPKGDMPFIESLAHTVIVRRNVGRDFGGYRTGVLHVLDNFTPSRLLILNDSVFFRGKGLREFFSALCEDRQYVGVAENHEFGYHIGSYALGFGRQVIEDPKFRVFWHRYRLTDIRPKVIRNGEIALNRLVINSIGARPTVVYSPDRLREALARLPVSELVETATQMPKQFANRDALTKLQQLASQWFEAASDPGGRPRSRSVDAAAELADASADDLRRIVSDDYRWTLQKSMLDFVFRGSQIHWGAVPFVKYLNCPIIKTDLVLRNVYGVGELSAFADYMTDQEFNEFFQTCTRRGVPQQHWKFAQRMMLAVGYL